MDTTTKKKKAWMNLQEHQMPHMKGMELGKRYHVTMEIEPTELSTGENEYNNGMHVEYAPSDMKPKQTKAPMTGRFKVHSISMSDMPKKSKGKSGPNARY